MDKVFIQGLVQLQCKRFRERREERGERGIEGGRREKGKGREEKKGQGSPTSLFCLVISFQTYSASSGNCSLDERGPDRGTEGQWASLGLSVWKAAYTHPSETDTCFPVVVEPLVVDGIFQES